MSTEQRGEQPAIGRENLVAFIACVALVVVTGATTDVLDITRFAWDFKYYIAMAVDGFDAQPLESPFAYRYATPFLVSGLRRGLDLSVATGFRVLAYAGAVLQLFGIFLLVRSVTESVYGAYLGVLVTALSLVNVKFLMFDVYRPDHFAYAFVVLGFYLCLERRFYVLLVVSAIGAQFREFTLVPLTAYMLAFLLRRDWKAFASHVLPALACVAVAAVLPRLLIPITHDSQYVPLSAGAFPKLLKVPFDLKRDVNFVFSIVAYLLPTLMLLTWSRARRLLEGWSTELKSLLFAYTVLVLGLSLYGGTDLTRFATFLFLPQVLVVAVLARFASRAEVAVMLVGVAVFNRVWMQFPMADLETYLDFYGGYSDRLNRTSLLRFVEICVIVVLSVIVRRQMTTPKVPNSALGTGYSAES